MISTKGKDSVLKLLEAGASVEVDGSKYGGDTLIEFANALRSGATLKVENSDSKSVETLLAVVAGRPEAVIVA